MSNRTEGKRAVRIPPLSTCLVVCILFFAAASMPWMADAAPAVDAGNKEAEQTTDRLDDAGCLTCHGEKKPGIALPDTDGEMQPLAAIDKGKIEKGVHSELTCITCHKEISDNTAPHKKSAVPKPNCVTCHDKLWASVKAQGLDVAKERLGIVVHNAASYKDSFHAKSAGKSGVKAYCDDCHDTHYFNVPPRGTSKRTDWHLTIPIVCGAKCHTDVLDEYKTSVHGTEILDKHNLKAAVCTDCHTSHEITKTSLDPFKLAITRRCGNCHRQNYISYTDTLHGQINVLGYPFTAKCYDCHGSHDILRVDDPDSSVSPKNRLKTCQQCHDGKKMPKAVKGFLSFGPHADDHDFKRYPQMWIASKFMHGLFLFVFSYFWAHSLLWWHREYKDRMCGVSHQHIQTDELLDGKVMQVRRFGLIWRIAHLLFAVSVMLLILTGMTVFFSYTTVAPVIMSALGGPKVAGLIHRVSAAIMLGIFFLHLIGVTINIIRNRKTFRWFGPDSLVPNLKDLRDAWGMFVWFVGKGPRPVFDRWTYWEKFDYWAVFWGMMVIGGSGMMLAFPHITARLFPGWIFNVIMVVHGEEAFLAAVFLFTVHFFNNHFRPDKIPPPDIVMFTGTQSLEEFRRDHALQYQRLVQAGQLEKYLVEVPSKPMTLGSKILGIVLLTCGLGLLAIVAIGFFTGNTPHSDMMTLF